MFLRRFLLLFPFRAVVPRPLIDFYHVYRSGDKVVSSGKWPAFVKAATEENSVQLEEDFSIGILRTVILCKQCAKEIGHIFNESRASGTPPALLRHKERRTALIEPLSLYSGDTTASYSGFQAFTV